MRFQHPLARASRLASATSSAARRVRFMPTVGARRAAGWTTRPAGSRPESTLLSWRSIAQMLLACFASGASRSLRISS